MIKGILMTFSENVDAPKEGQILDHQELTRDLPTFRAPWLKVKATQLLYPCIANAYIYCVSHNVWRNEQLGRGLRSFF